MPSTLRLFVITLVLASAAESNSADTELSIGESDEQYIEGMWDARVEQNPALAAEGADEGAAGVIGEPFPVSIPGLSPEDVECERNAKEIVLWQPELAYAPLLQYRAAHPTPETKAVAFVVRGLPFRADNYSEPGRQTARCDRGGWALQQIATASHIKHIIEPLERLGFRVDVFAASFPCVEHPEWTEQLVSWYGKRVVNSSSCSEAESFTK
jgi:hypothetical protein